jgi:hypothetical protein
VEVAPALEFGGIYGAVSAEGVIIPGQQWHDPIAGSLRGPGKDIETVAQFQKLFELLK